MYYTGIDPMTGKEVHVARNLRDRKLQRALMQFFKPENYFLVRAALIQAGRQDLMGKGCDCLIPAQPPKEALQERRKQANDAVASEYVHKIPKTNGAGKGYRPGRPMARRQQKRKDTEHGPRLAAA